MSRRNLVALFSVLALAAAACSGGGEAVDVDGTDAGETTTAAGGDDGAGDAAGSGGTLIAALGGEPDRLDPHLTTSSFSFKVIENVYDTLAQPDENLEMVPALAESWETSEDDLTWTFSLREGVTFHDGSSFDAEDVKASFDRIKAEGANSFRLEAVEAVNVVDDLTVELQLTRPMPNLLTQIGGFKGTAIMSADDLAEGSDLNLDQQTNGTGPFQLETFTSGDSIELSAFEQYWRADDLPRLDGVTFRFIPEESVKVTNLEGGEVDWIDTVPPQRLGELEERDDIEVGRVPGNDYWYMATNIAREPFDQREVRRAIAFALSPEDIASAAKFDAATPNETAIPPSSFWYYDYSPYGRDVQQAAELLDQAGVGDGFEMDLMVTNEFPETVTAAEVISAQLAEVGITVNIRTLDFATWLSEQEQGNFDSFMLGWLGNLDPDGFYYAQHHSTGNFNFHSYSNPEADQLLDEGRRETDQDERKEIYDQAAQIIVDDASYIYFYNPDIVSAWAPNVSGYEARADNAVRFTETAIESE